MKKLLNLKLVQRQKVIRFLTIGAWTLSIILSITVAIVYSLLNPTVKKAITMATTVMPETFTELYFENHINLPTKTIANIPYSFSFTVHNLEHKDMVYPYEVYISSGSARQTISTGIFTLAQNAYKNVVITYTLPQEVLHEEVVVNLRNKNQQINFFVNNKE